MWNWYIDEHCRDATSDGAIMSIVIISRKERRNSNETVELELHTRLVVTLGDLTLCSRNRVENESGHCHQMLEGKNGAKIRTNMDKEY
ncbi:hypothetical protein E2986_04692 [Frieseomelitta varia]|uniref:Uncharacterized protein n=1 Tax=Frieseomelitta varia TaxID=561572 RepID=A0A833RSZ9_9HYME|nr:hypothetical protein E2986_04692 [Frieseomelitta varia]